METLVPNFLNKIPEVSCLTLYFTHLISEYEHESQLSVHKLDKISHFCRKPKVRILAESQKFYLAGKLRKSKAWSFIKIAEKRKKSLIIFWLLLGFL